MNQNTNTTRGFKMTRKILRRDFFKLGAAATSILAAPTLLTRKVWAAEGTPKSDSIVGEVKDGLGLDYSPTTGKELKAVPSACWQCVARDGIICHVEDGRLTSIEGNPKLRRSNGKICAKGQAGANQVYDPDRLLFPMKRVGERGSGKWKRISWDDAIKEIGARLKKLKDDGHPEKFMFHYGRMKASASKLIKTYFLTGYGTKTVGNHTSICESAKWTGQEFIFGKHYDVNDIYDVVTKKARSKYILIIGCNPMETHTSHIPLRQRLAGAIAAGVKTVTVDVRLSNTAAASTEWVPVKPGTDLALVLAMMYHIIDKGLVPASGKEFVDNWTGTTVDELKGFLTKPADHVPDKIKGDQPAGGYTPAWAAGITGIDQAKIIEIAEDYAKGSPGSTIISYRGATQHYNGVQVERAVCTLEALCGNVDVVGGRVHAVGAPWSYSKTYPKPSTKTKGISVTKGEGFPFPSHSVSHQVLEQIKKKVDAGEDSPDVYMSYCYTAVYANGDMQGNIDILKSEKYIPFSVNVNTSYDESAALADIILPDATYLERWDWEDMVSYDQLPEFYIRQPAVDPVGDVRDFKDVCYDLAVAIGDKDLIETMKFKTGKEFVRAACEDTAAVKKAGGFEYMKKHGALVDPDAKPKYLGYKKEVTLDVVKADDIKDDDTKKYLFETDEGIVWEATKATYKDYRSTSSAYKKYKGQKVNGKYYAGFKPDKLNKGGLYEIKSPLLEGKGWGFWPAWMQAPEHKSLASDELILTNFKIATQIHSRSQNCKYLSELNHAEPAWINTKTAADLGIKDGDEITIEAKPIDSAGTMKMSGKTSMKTPVKVTAAVAPGVIAMSHHFGHWEYGRYASGNKNPMVDDPDAVKHAETDPDAALQWWDDHGTRPNWIMPNAGDPICGSFRFNDLVVKVKA